MTNRRRSPVLNSYQTVFLRSSAWFARRDRWFRKQERMLQPLVCAICGTPGTKKTLELHHLDYAGVTVVDGKWRAFESHSDLIPLHPACHELLHKLIDRDTVLSRQRTRRDASLIGIGKLQDALDSEENRHG